MLALDDKLKATIIGLILVLIGFLLAVYGFQNFLNRLTYLAVGFVLMLIGVWVLSIKLKQWIHNN